MAVKLAASDQPKIVSVVAAVIRRSDGRILIAQRPAHHRIAGGLWEFPGGKIEAGESPEVALAREIKEELGLKIAVGAKIGTVLHTYASGGGKELAIELTAYWASVSSILPIAEASSSSSDLVESQIKLDGVAAIEWVSGDQMPSHNFAAADIPFLKMIWT